MFKWLIVAVIAVCLVRYLLWRASIRQHLPPNNLGPGHPNYDASWEAKVPFWMRPFRHSHNRHHNR